MKTDIENSPLRVIFYGVILRHSDTVLYGSMDTLKNSEELSIWGILLFSLDRPYEIFSDVTGWRDLAALPRRE